MLTNLGQDTEECSPSVGCHYLNVSQGCSLLLTLTLCSRGKKDQERMGKEHGPALITEGQSSVLNTDPPSADVTRGCAVKGSDQMGRLILVALLEQKYLRGMTDQSAETWRAHLYSSEMCGPHFRGFCS